MGKSNLRKIDKKHIREKIHAYLSQDERLKRWFLLYDSKEDKILKLKFQILDAPIRREVNINKLGRQDEYMVATATFMDESENKTHIDFYLFWRGQAGIEQSENWWSIEFIKINRDFKSQN